MEEALLQIPKNKLNWLGQVAIGDLLVIETRLFNQSGQFSATQDTLSFWLYKQIKYYEWQYLELDCYYYRGLEPSLVVSDYILPVSDSDTVAFVLESLETMLDGWLCCINSNLPSTADTAFLVECYEVCQA